MPVDFNELRRWLSNPNEEAAVIAALQAAEAVADRVEYCDPRSDCDEFHKKYLRTALRALPQSPPPEKQPACVECGCARMHGPDGCFEHACTRYAPAAGAGQ